MEINYAKSGEIAIYVSSLVISKNVRPSPKMAYRDPYDYWPPPGREGIYKLAILYYSYLK
jgi:hypothetical protein